MGILTLQDISQTYDEKHLLRGVSMVVNPGDRIGVLGQNGCGKSTLMRIIAGIEDPDHGVRTLQRGLRVGYLEQDPALDPTLTITEAVRLGLSEREAVVAQLDRVHEAMAAAGPDELGRLLVEQARLEEELEARGGHDVEHKVAEFVQHLGLAGIDTRCGALSGGERRRVALARLLLSSPDLLVLDEPTNHLDAEVTDWLEDHLLSRRGPLILVTHDRYFLDRLVDRTIEIENGVLHEYQGGYAEFLAARAGRLEREHSEESTRLNLLRRETEWMRRGPPARSTKAKARIDRYHALVDAAPERGPGELEFAIPSGPRLGERVLRLQGVTAGYGDGPPLLRDLDLEIGARERIGVVGPNGAGKSTFLKLCLGELQPQQGEVAVGATVKFAAIDQRRSDLDDGKTVLEEVAGKNDYVHVDGRMIRVESFLEQFLFPGAMKHAKVGTLSGGERNRVLLCKLLGADGNVLVLDEPTNDLDLMTLRVLEEALVAFPGVVLCVSHDRYFLDRIATRILYLDGRGGHRVHAGDLSGLLEKLSAEAEARAASSAAAQRPQPPSPSKPAARKLSTRERRELDELPDKLAVVEARVGALDAQLADPVTWQGARDVDPQALTAERAAAQAEADALYARWTELEAIAEGSG